MKPLNWEDKGERETVKFGGDFPQPYLFPFHFHTRARMHTHTRESLPRNLSTRIVLGSEKEIRSIATVGSWISNTVFVLHAEGPSRLMASIMPSR